MIQMPIFPENFKDGKLAVRFPHDLCMHLPTICKHNQLDLYPWGTLRPWLDRRIAEGVTVYVYYDVGFECVSVFAETYWRKERYTLIDVDELFPDPECTDILDFL